MVLAGYAAVREALVGTGQELVDRPPVAIFRLIQGGKGRCVGGEAWPAGRGGHQHCPWGGTGVGARCSGGRGTPRGDTARARISGVAPMSAAGVFFSSGEPWKAARQLTVRTLHDLGVGRGPVAGKILQELSCLLGLLDQCGGEWGWAGPSPGALPAEARPLSPQAGPSPWPCSAGLPPTSPSRSSSASGSTTRTPCLCPCWASSTRSWSSWGPPGCR